MTGVNLTPRQSDVWSFGVLLWEAISRGHVPYGVKDNKDVISYVRGGGRLEVPKILPEDVAETIKKW